MLRVTVERIPHGEESKRRVIGTAEIVSIGYVPGSSTVCDYRADFLTNRSGDDGPQAKTVVVKHARNDVMWFLIAKAIGGL